MPRKTLGSRASTPYNRGRFLIILLKSAEHGNVFRVGLEVFTLFTGAVFPTESVVEEALAIQFQALGSFAMTYHPVFRRKKFLIFFSFCKTNMAEKSEHKSEGLEQADYIFAKQMHSRKNILSSKPQGRIVPAISGKQSTIVEAEPTVKEEPEQPEQEVEPTPAALEDDMGVVLEDNVEPESSESMFDTQTQIILGGAAVGLAVVAAAFYLYREKLFKKQS